MADNGSHDCCGLLNADFGTSLHGEMVVVVVMVVVMMVMVIIIIIISMHRSLLACIGHCWPDNSILIVKRYRNETKTYLKPK